MSPFEGYDTCRSGIYQENETGKDHHEDDEFPHLSPPGRPPATGLAMIQSFQTATAGFESDRGASAVGAILIPAGARSC